MNKSTIAIITFGVLVLGGFAYIWNAWGSSSEHVSIPTSPAETIQVKHAFVNGTHHYSGMLALPTPCHEISSQAIVAESFPEQVRVTLKTKGTSDFCAQVITQIPFDIEFTASKDAKIVSATLDGKAVTLQVVDGEPIVSDNSDDSSCGAEPTLEQFWDIDPKDIPFSEPGLDVMEAFQNAQKEWEFCIQAEQDTASSSVSAIQPASE